MICDLWARKIKWRSMIWGLRFKPPWKIFWQKCFFGKKIFKPPVCKIWDSCLEKCFLVAANIANTDLGPKCWAQKKICLVLEVIFITKWRKWTEYIFLRIDRIFVLFWEIYISRQLNLFLRIMFVVVGLSRVTTTLKKTIISLS